MDCKEIVKKATEIDAELRAIWEKMDALLDPMLAQASTMTKEELDYLIGHLPSGFHRIELRTIRANRFPEKDA